MRNKLPTTEDLDFHYLLSLLPALRSDDRYAWLPELFSTIGHERLIDLCLHAGGEYIRIPTLEELSDSIDALQWFYDVYISHTCDMDNVPKKFRDTVIHIRGIINASNN